MIELTDRELDVLVAERVFGWQWFHCVAKTGVERNQFCTQETADIWAETGWTMGVISTPPADEFSDSSAVPKFSTDISAAFQVVESMNEQGWSFACTLYKEKPPYASFCKGTVASSRNAEAESLPRAICLAALSANESSPRHHATKISGRP